MSELNQTHCLNLWHHGIKRHISGKDFYNTTINIGLMKLLLSYTAQNPYKSLCVCDCVCAQAQIFTVNQRTGHPYFLTQNVLSVVKLEKVFTCF